MSQSEFQTSVEAAHEAGVSRERIVRLVQCGTIEGQLVAGRWLVERASLDRFISNQAEKKPARR